MAKQRTITRTIEKTQAEVFMLDLTTGETSTIVVAITGSTADADLLEVAKSAETETSKVVAVKPDTKVTTTRLYEMSESDFIQYSVDIGEGRK